MNSAHAIQVERIRQMTADEKVKLSHALWIEAWKAATAGVYAQHPEWSEVQVAVRVRELMCDAGS